MTISNEELRRQNDGLKVEVDGLKVENSDLKVEVDAFKKEISGFKMENTRVKVANDCLKVENDRLKLEVTHLKAENQQLQVSNYIINTHHLVNPLFSINTISHYSLANCVDIPYNGNSSRKKMCANFANLRVAIREYFLAEFSFLSFIYSSSKVKV